MLCNVAAGNEFHKDEVMCFIQAILPGRVYSFDWFFTGHEKLSSSCGNNMVREKVLKMLLWERGGFSMRRRLRRTLLIIMFGLIMYALKKVSVTRRGSDKIMREL